MSKHADMYMYMQHTQTHASTLGLVHAIVRPGIARLTLRCTHTCSHACPTHTLARHTIQGSGSACPSSLGSRSLGPRSLLLRLHRLRSFAVAAAHAAARATCTAPARAAPAHAAPAHAAPARAAPARPTWRPADTEGWIGARGSMPGSACAVEAAAHMNSPNTARGAWSRRGSSGGRGESADDGEGGKGSSDEQGGHGLEVARRAPSNRAHNKCDVTTAPMRRSQEWP